MNVRIADHGSIVLVIPTSQAALEWLHDNVQEDAMWWGGGLVVEPRYVDDLLAGLEEAGLY